MGGETEAQRGTQPCPTSFFPPLPGRTMSSCRVGMAVLVGRARENWQLIRGKLGQGSARPQAVGGRGPGTALPHPPPLELQSVESSWNCLHVPQLVGWGRAPPGLWGAITTTPPTQAV